MVDNAPDIWPFEKGDQLEVVKLPASEWPTKVGLLPYLDQLRSRDPRSLEARTGAVLFEFVDEKGDRIVPDEKEVRYKLENCTTKISRDEQYAYRNKDGLLLRRTTSPISLREEKLCPWKYYESCVEHSKPTVPVTKEGMLSLFDKACKSKANIRYKTDCYSHYSSGAITELNDIISPISFTDPMFGINQPMCLIAPAGALSSFHVEELRLWSVNENELGLKTWFFLVDPDGEAGPEDMAKRLEDAIRNHPGNDEKFKDCANFMMSKVFAIHPGIFRAKNIRLVVAIQHAGQFIFTGRHTYHMVLANRATVSFAQNSSSINFQPSLSHACNSEDTDENDRHNGDTGKLVFREMTSGTTGYSGLRDIYLLSLQNNTILQSRLPILRHFRDPIHVGVKEVELRMALDNCLLVWTNYDNEDPSPGVGYVVHLDDSSKIAILTTKIRVDAELFARHYSSVFISPDEYMLHTKTVKGRRALVHIEQGKVDFNVVEKWRLELFPTLINNPQLAIPPGRHPQSTSVQPITPVSDLEDISGDEAPHQNKPSNELIPIAVDKEDEVSPALAIMPKQTTTRSLTGYYHDSQKLRISGMTRSCTLKCYVELFQQFGTVTGLIYSTYKRDGPILVFDQSDAVDRALQAFRMRSFSHKGAEIQIGRYMTQYRQPPPHTLARRVTSDARQQTVPYINTWNHQPTITNIYNNYYDHFPTTERNRQY